MLTPKQKRSIEDKGSSPKVASDKPDTVKLNKGFLSLRKDQCVFIVRKLDVRLLVFGERGRVTDSVNSRGVDKL